jgi:hypothetical protein
MRVLGAVLMFVAMAVVVAVMRVLDARFLVLSAARGTRCLVLVQ